MDGFIEFSGDRYQVIIREAGRVSLLRYNSKTRMWIQLNFDENADGSEAERYILGALANQYIERMAGTQGKSV